MKLEFNLNDPLESLNAISIISGVHPGMLEHVLKQLTEPQPVEQPAPGDTKVYDKNGVVVQPAAPEVVKTTLTLVKSDPVVIYTQAEVNAAVQDYASKKGFPAAMALLKEFGVERAGQLQPEQFTAFIGRTQESK